MDTSTKSPSNHASMSGGESIEALRQRLALLVEERQRLREQGTSPFVLERNRRAIIAEQRSLSVALGAEYGARAA